MFKCGQNLCTSLGIPADKEYIVWGVNLHSFNVVLKQTQMLYLVILMMLKIVSYILLIMTPTTQLIIFPSFQWDFS